MARRFVLAAVLIFVAFVASLWIEQRSEITLPAPTGPFAVGRTLFDWRDDRSIDPLAPRPGAPREVLVWMWYPALREPNAKFDNYIPAAVRRPAARRSILTLLTRDPSKVHGHSLANAAVSPQQPSYPVAILRAGGSSEVTKYSTLAEDLASHGYVVVGFDAPYRTSLVVFPDGRIIARTSQNNPELVSGSALKTLGAKLLSASIADTAFVLDRLEELNRSDPTRRFNGRLDLTQLGVFGHSFGGATALQFCHDDPRCKAGIDIDGAPLGSVIQTGLNKPFMFLLSDHSGESDPDARRIMAEIRSIYDRLPANARAYVVIRGTNHFTFSDDGALLKSYAFRALLRAFGKLGISGRRQLALTTDYVHTFFDTYVRGTAPPKG
jgi:predicted dienelactone hydrolase